jgi:hypothetical protein
MYFLCIGRTPRPEDPPMRAVPSLCPANVLLPPALLFSLAALAGCKPDAGLTKFNSAPAAQITDPADGDTALSGTTLMLRGAASDPNHDAAELTARWFVDDAEVCAATPADDGTTTCDVVVPNATAMDVRLEVIDPEGAAGTDSRSLVVTPNANPVATIAGPVADGVYYSDQLVTFRGTVSDMEDAPDALTVWWEDGATRLEAVESTPTGSGEVLGYSTLAAGAHALELHVQDTTGNEAIATVLIDVGPPNSAPDCAITAPDDDSAGEAGTSVTFRGEASDPDIAADLLSVTWTSDKDGWIGTSTPTSRGTVTFPYADLSVNTHVVSMQVVDEVGATCTAEVIYSVGSPPSIVLETPLPGEVSNEGDTLSFSALVSDREDAPGDLLVIWESDVDGVFYAGPPDSGGVAQRIETGLSVGDHVLTVTVTDPDGLTATALGTFTINGVPTAPGVSITPSSPDGDDDLRVSIDSASSDSDGDPISYLYAWSVDGVASGASASSTLHASATARGEVWTVTVTATDGLGTSAAGTASVTIANTAPTLATLALSPDPAYEGDTLTCSAGATSDADGDSVGLSYEWYVDGVALGWGSATLDSALFDRDEAVYCTATPSDGADDGATRTSNTVTIQNTAPITSVALSPSTVYTNDTLTATASGSDADGDSLTTTYDWYVDGALVQSGATPTLSGASHFDRDEDVYVTVTVDDGTDTASATSSSVTVSNTAPTAPVVELTPVDAESGDDLTCAVVTESTDADGDAITYTFAWDVDGVDYTGATDSARESVIAGVDVGGGETWTCDVAAWDPDITGGSGDAAVTVAYGETVWTSIWSHALSSVPSGSIYYDGGWLDQYAGSMYGRAAWIQPSDWNGMFIPTGRSTTDYEAVEIDVFAPSHSNLSFYPLSGYLPFADTQNHIGLHITGSTGLAHIPYDSSTSGTVYSVLASFATSFTAGSWHTLRVEMDFAANEVRYLLNGSEIYSTTSIPLSTMSSDYVTLGTSTTCCSSPANVAWSNLEIFEGTR